jgi:16S rRNA (guanine527-N7)-methyltransferase
MNQDPTHASTGSSLNHLLSKAGLELLDANTLAKFDDYLALILRWNARMNLTAIRDAEGILSRHFVESIACAQLLPRGIGSLLDFGTGAGFPGIPIAVCRPDITITLAESQSRKAAFLHEAVRVLGLNTDIFANRAENLGKQFDGVTLRAVDRMEQAVAAATSLIRVGGWLVVLTTATELPRVQRSAGEGFQWLDLHNLSGSDQQVLAFATKISSAA